MARVGGLQVAAATGAATAAAAYLLLRRKPACLPPPADGVEDFNSATAVLGPFASITDYVQRWKCYVKVLCEYPKL